MADYIAAQITIGGCISRKLIPRLCRALCAEALALEWGNEAFQPASVEDLLSARQVIDGELVLRLFDDSAAYGEFPLLEVFLQKYRIAFDRQSEGHYTAPPRLVSFRPKAGVREWFTTSEGSLVVEASPLWELQGQVDSLIRSHRHGRTRQTQDRLLHLSSLLKEAVPDRPAPLPAFEIGKTVALRHSA